MRFYQAVHRLAFELEFSEFLLSDHQLAALEDVRDFLCIPYSVQEYLSSDYTPTAPWVLSAYTEMLELLELAKMRYPKIRHAIQASILALKEYMAYTRQTRAYALAMGKSIAL